MKRFIRRPSPAMVVASIALFSSMGGVSYGLATGSINGREIKNGSVRGIDVKNRSLTGSDIAADRLGGGAIKESSLGSVPLALGVDNFAVVTPAGALSRGRGVGQAQRTAEGRYAVTFNRDVRGCVYVATIGDEGTAGTGSGTVSVASNAINPNTVNVRTARASDDAQRDRSFHLIVGC